MGDTLGVGAARVEPIRRIAARVAKSPAAGRYFAVGKADGMRAKVEAALRKLLGEEHVVTVDLAAAEQDPWNELRRFQQKNGLEARGNLLCVRGLGAMARAAEAAGRPNPYAQLNLARDAWGATGTHALFWIDGLEEFDRFLDHAPDLWSHRDVVAWFLTREDFQEPEGPPPIGDPVEEKAQAARRILADPNVSAVERVFATADLADALMDQGELLAAWAVLEGAPQLPGRGERGSLQVEVWYLGRRGAALRLLGRSAEAAALARKALKKHARAPADLRHELQHDLARSVGAEEGIPMLRELAQVSGGETKMWATDNLVLRLSHMGRASEAERVLGFSRAAEPRWLEARNAAVAWARGDLLSALRADELSAVSFDRSGHRRHASNRSSRAATVLDGWGEWREAEALVEMSLRGDEVARLPATERLDVMRWRRGSSDFEAAFTLLRRVTGHPVARAVASDACSAVLDTLESDADPATAPLEPPEAALVSLHRTARADHDAEVEGLARWSLARLALLRGDRAKVASLAHDLLRWCRRWRGLVEESHAWALLARSAPTVAIAKEHAARAVATADRSPSIFAQIAAREALAEVHVRAGSTPDAVAALNDALALARPEGLRLEELRLLHRLAELPDHPGARDAASAALTLATTLMLPREEARALLTLCELEKQAGRPIPARRLDRAQEIVEELGPPRLRARLAALGVELNSATSPSACSRS